MIPPQLPEHVKYSQKPHENDVLCGRGGTTYHHPGNKCFREMIRDKKHDYFCAQTNAEKQAVALNIVQQIRNLNPPGRFIRQDKRNMQWYDIGNKDAMRKVSQAIRDEENGDSSSSCTKSQNSFMEECKTTNDTSWPLKNIKQPHQNDVICGRGGGSNRHTGNKHFRKTVEEHRVEYLNSTSNREKQEVTETIVQEIRSLTPPGRFIMQDMHSKLWYDIGDNKARCKTSQALREKAPMIRKEQDAVTCLSILKLVAVADSAKVSHVKNITSKVLNHTEDVLTKVGAIE